MKLRTVLLLTILFFTGQIYGQLYEVSLDQKIENATTIIEGKVIESQSYMGNDNEIYTAHKIELSKIWKGSQFETELTIITRGGQVDRKLTTWSNFLTLQKGDYGIFFLQSTLRPNIENGNFSKNAFEVYSSQQGFLKYTNFNQSQFAQTPFGSYDNIEEQVFKKIRLAKGQEKIIGARDSSHDDGKEKGCIVYTFEPVIETLVADGFKLGADVKVHMTEGSKALYQSLVVLEYDTTFFGSYVATNGTVEISDGDISGSSNYTLTVTDLAYNKLQVKLLATSTTSLSTITTTKSWVARILLTIADPFGTPSVSFDQTAMEQGNLYHDSVSGQNKPFDCIEIVNEVFALVCPDIVSFSPDTLGAGSGNILTIRGNNFGPESDTLPALGPGVLLTQIDLTGTVGHHWLTPFKSEYVFWSDTMVQVKVPSLAFDLAGGLSTANTPGTGIIGMMRDGCIDSTATSLYIKYAAITQAVGDLSTGEPITVQTRLANQNGDGGYDLYFTPAFQTFDTIAVDAFSRALATWRCATGVNFRTIEFDSIPAAVQGNACKIDYGAMPAGIPATIVAYTDLDSLSFCTSGTDIWYALQKKFSLIFSNVKTWHTTTDTMAIDWIDTLDMETVALHELGHAHQLFHSNNTPNLMHYLANTYQRTIEPDDLCGGMYIMDISTDATQICTPVMQAVPAADCGDVTTNIFNISSNHYDITVFPNPANNILNIDIGELSNSNSNIQVSIFNSIGQRLSNNRLYNKKQQIDIQSFPSGILIGVLSIDGIPTKSFKVIKQ